MIKVICPICHTEHLVTSPRHKYCSEDCRRLAHNKVALTYVHKQTAMKRKDLHCPVCHQLILSSRGKYCSEKCRREGKARYYREKYHRLHPGARYYGKRNSKGVL